ncbi:16S rRNA (cytosine967-C5)-methyltransferase [Novimethylophilus kurashikiensis]|uniref:16S rRNA (cytosine(967)-C(5))-methyltransferase n=1 Tax=Novimethylophilus kurashikiensis TaxID=1825523 RepID=A0A2R5F7K2_9PROT|nr:16S rRNA (cytosine(967)-C(5))-methyltransferase RsmB [Novimethylophilus kurashikiensis]GBG13809.1 16S rRNA (cytosine967-C5)-methyltransferase [Novimethylophilus kurashikiensis]
MYKVQLLAAKAVAQVIDGHNLNQILDNLKRSHSELTPAERSAFQDISYTTLRWLSRLEGVLALLVQRPLRDQRVRSLLLVALAQLTYGKSAEHAVVDHAVRAANSLKLPWAKGLVNGVLRNFLRQREQLLRKVDADIQSRLSYPEWWLAKAKQQYPEAWEAMLAVGNLHPPMTLRVNRRKVGRDEYLILLAQADIQAKPLGCLGVLLEKPVPVEKLPKFGEGWVSVQDYGAQQAGFLLEVQDGMRVLDACSAPGGKTAHLLEIADLDLTALDHDVTRLQKVQDNLRRLELKAEVREGNAAKPQEWWNGRLFDRILADVPCSASGIVRRHPDIKWLRRDADIAGFAAQQSLILKGLWSTLAKGGKLLYATCSVFHEENVRQVDSFLAETPDARRLPLAWEQFSGLEKEGQLLPCELHDGFYYALLQKI